MMKVAQIDLKNGEIKIKLVNTGLIILFVITMYLGAQIVALTVLNLFK